MKDRYSSVEQALGQKIWTIVELFYRSHTAFKEAFERYEEKVQNYSGLLGIPRANLRLNSRELASLLDLKSLERLRNGYIHELKDLCHQVFRSQDQTDRLDRYVSDIFHEISILKEEHYNVITYAPLYERDSAEVELRHILDEAHTMFPHKLQHIRYLFGRAQVRMEEHLESFSQIQLFLRSLYLNRYDFVANAYPDGVETFYRIMYPLGAFEGYYEVARSFYHSGFFDEACEAFEKAEAAYRPQALIAAEKREEDNSECSVARLQKIYRSMKAIVGRLEKRHTGARIGSELQSRSAVAEKVANQAAGKSRSSRTSGKRRATRRKKKTRTAAPTTVSTKR